MRQLNAFNNISIDGYFTTGDGKLDWVTPSPEIDKRNAASTEGNGTILFGRKTYQMFESFWPTVTPENATDPHNPGRFSPEILVFAQMINGAKKIVYSRTLKDVTWHNAHLRAEFDPQEVEQLKAEKGSAIIIFGSSTITSALVQAGLIDELTFVINPVILGSGRPLIAGLPSRRGAKLVESTSYPSGHVFQRYQPERN